MRDTPNTTNPEDERAYARIEQALAALGSEHSPPPGWEEKILAAVDEEEKRRKREPQNKRGTSWWQRLPSVARWSLPVGPLVAAAVVALLWVQTKPQEELAELRFARAVMEDAPVVRGTDCTLKHGEKLSLTSRAAHRELRVYRNRALVFRCGTTTPAASPATCVITPEGITATWVPELLGTYEILAAASNQPLPALKGELDGDSAALVEKHIRLHREAPFSCQ